ncbi:MAG: PIN domain-containing protein [bacterium]|nr:PIN domain-containing protein [bacterium]MCY4104973.1 PIN domain-containing protein [bacterium]
MLLDTDVLIDVALDRHPHADSSSELLDRLEQGRQRAFIAWHSISNFYYIVAPSAGGADARDFIAELSDFVQVAVTDTESLRYAVGLPMADFEDAMQVAAARACGAQRIVTRNVKDYRNSPIRAITPAEALGEFFDTP